VRHQQQQQLMLPTPEPSPQQQHRHHQQQQQQQHESRNLHLSVVDQQQQHEVAVVSPGVVSAHMQLQQQAQQQQDLDSQQQIAAAGYKLCDVRVCVEAALNLQLPEVGEGEAMTRLLAVDAPLVHAHAGVRADTRLHSCFEDAPAPAPARPSPPAPPLCLCAGWQPALYVRYDWPDCNAVITTPLVYTTRGPLGGSCTAKWLHCMHLPLLLLHAGQALPAAGDGETEAAAAGGGGSGGVASQASVLFQVWVRLVPAMAAAPAAAGGAIAAAAGSPRQGAPKQAPLLPAPLPPLFAGLAAVPAASDVLLGCASLDLAPLRHLGLLEGWYNISDVAAPHARRGQLKVMAAGGCGLRSIARGAVGGEQRMPWQHHAHCILCAHTKHVCRYAQVALTPLGPLDGAPRALPLAADSLQQILASWPSLHAAAGGGVGAARPEPLLQLTGEVAAGAEAAAYIEDLSDRALMSLAEQSATAAEAAAAALEAAAAGVLGGAGGATAGGVLLVAGQQQDELLTTLRANMQVRWIARPTRRSNKAVAAVKRSCVKNVTTGALGLYCCGVCAPTIH
jgi:hypothetical protein